MLVLSTLVVVATVSSGGVAASSSVAQQPLPKCSGGPCKNVLYFLSDDSAHTVQPDTDCIHILSLSPTSAHT